MLATPTQTDLDRVNTKYPAYNLMQVNEGKRLYESYCAGCHKLKNPASKTEERWKEIVPKMVVKAKKKDIVIDENSQALILEYLVTMSKK
ncbi:MAG: hypothetical protein CFE21_17210 [Bacteroidetes bacterium B1(2017)]|nr:MAG: hypothetical protein CFE21_17210 [Bacteroidetes bacterium B1(2017)]